ncbi:histidine kinase [Sulfurimonas hongkongensis]|uniref:histidine kinase n=1 Tax=Sulfurimonas hongkongensis TaxID=1172190 RepID=T0IZT5_9BACT|nr:HAMP domain-containing sensor histidine kinase [Sulfurimonas hongkongensis]EQB34310.1 histidine kinase [Sulfurimonas hongkongensis]
MFRNLRITIFVFYFLSVSAFLATLHYLLAVVEVQNVFLLAVVMTCFSALGAVFMSKLSIDPLEEHVSNLQNLSKETLHELNLPISTIMTNLNMLKKKTTDEKDLKRLKRIDTACAMLQERYNELDYMIKKQTLHEIKEEFMLDELLLLRVDFLKHIYPNMEFNLNLEKTKIISDKTGLAKIIDNIIDNAVKYSPNSNRCDIRLNDHSLHIEDFGCGMDEVELIRIYDTYYQSNDTMRGFGIGLSMVKRFCDSQNIQLNIKSKLGFGTTVLLKFKEN